MKKIYFLINSLSSGGAEKVLTVIANELVKQNYKVEIIFLEKNEFYELPKKVKKIYPSNFDGNESGLKKLLYLPLLAWELKKYIKRNNVQLIQSHLFRANYVNVLAKVFGANHKTQLVTAGRVSRYKKLGIIGSINLFLIKYLYKQSDLLIYKSKGMQEDIQKLFDFNNKSIIINNPYNIKEIRKLSREKVDNFNFEKNRKYIISVGRLIKLKRNHEIVEVLSELPKNIELIFLGEGNERKDLEKLAKNLNIDDRVHFLGRVKNPYKYIARSDIFVSCSESEGFPNVIVESMICGCPVISSDCISGPREILGENEYGLLFDVGDKNMLKRHIITLLEDDKVRINYIKKAKIRANDFSVEKIVEQYKKVLLNENSNNP